MKTKLTLSVDQELIHFAQRQARSNGKSISGMFSEFLLARKAQLEYQTTPKARTMVGTLKNYPINDSKTEVRSAYAKKYLS